jgi:uncharacterized membrane protein
MLFGAYERKSSKGRLVIPLTRSYNMLLEDPFHKLPEA